MAAGLRSAMRKMEGAPAVTVRLRPVAEGRGRAWREMMALLPQVEPVWLSSEQQTCTECDSVPGLTTLPPDCYIG